MEVAMYGTILVPLDGSSCSERALPVASALAQVMSAKVVLVRAVPEAAGRSQEGAEAESPAVREAGAYLAEFAGRLSKQGIPVTTVVPVLPPCDAILAEAKGHAADLIVMCSHGRSGIGRWLYGTVAEGVLMHSRLPVLLVRPADVMMQFVPRGAALLVPLDGSAFAESILPHATALAQALGGRLVLLRVVPLSDYVQPLVDDTYVIQQQLVDDEQAAAEKYLAGVADRIKLQTGLRVDTRAGLGWPAEMILDEAKSAGAVMVAMATHGHTGLRELIMGGVALEVLRQSARPILLIRPGADTAG
jgi:nucleotide-binding universal stress UspA family protein